MAAANLEDAANQTYARLDLRWVANNIRTHVQAFIVAAAAVFSDDTPTDRPVGNWIVPLTALQAQMNASSNNPMDQALFNTCVDYIYRMCLAGAYAQAQSRISNTQATALLAAWNTNIF